MKRCEKCKTEKNVSQYSKGMSQCKECHNEYVKDHHKKNGRSYQRTKDDLKKDAKCEICSRKDFLEFDHIDRSKKNITIGRSQSSKKIREERKLCRILCMWCHRKVTRQFNKAKQEERMASVKNEAMMLSSDENGKECLGIYCNGRKIHIANFYIRSTNGRPKGRCKYCSKYYDYEKSQKTQEYINSLKRDIGRCQICKVRVTIGTEECFDFDHIDPSKKACNVARFVSYGAPKKKIDPEVSKCRLLCCLCHLEHTKKTKVFHKKKGAEM